MAWKCWIHGIPEKPINAKKRTKLRVKLQKVFYLEFIKNFLAMDIKMTNINVDDPFHALDFFKTKFSVLDPPCTSVLQSSIYQSSSSWLHFGWKSNRRKRSSETHQILLILIMYSFLFNFKILWEKIHVTTNSSKTYPLLP